MKAFGPGPVPYGLERVDIPTGQPCSHCAEPISEEDFGVFMPRFPSLALEPLHRECFVRLTVGSVGHLMGKCSCKGGREEDPPGMTRRQAAKEVQAIYSKQTQYPGKA